MKLIIDCDPGNGVPGANVDDAIALAFALRHPSLDVRAIWTVFGNTSAAAGSEAALRLVAGQAAAIPVRCGSDRPLSGREPAEVADPMPDLIRDLADAGAGVVLACLGPLTNLARVIREAPEALAGVERICLMGGLLADGEPVDTNFAVDPVAAAVVLQAGIPLTIVPLDVTRTTRLSRAAWQDLRRRATGEDGDRLSEMAVWLEPWLAHSERTRPVDGMWLHDLVVVAALAEPAVVTSQLARVGLAEEPAGKLAIRPDGVEVELVNGVDNAALIDLLAGTIAPQAHQPGLGRPPGGR